MGAVIRCEPVFRADSSVFVIFKFHQLNEPDFYHISIMIIDAVKSVKGDKSLCARGIRHRDHRVYHIGALSLLLITQFHIWKLGLIGI